MRLPSHLVLSRHGVFYLRLQSGGNDRRVSLRTKDLKKAMMASYEFGLARMKSPRRISELIVEHTPDGGLKISTDNSEAENLTALKLTNKLYEFKLRLAEIQARDGYESKPSLTPEQLQEVLQIQAAVLRMPMPEVTDPKPLIKKIRLRDAFENYKPVLDECEWELKSIRMAKSALERLVLIMGEDFDMANFIDEEVKDLWMKPRKLEVAGSTVKKELSWVRGFSEWAAHKDQNYCSTSLTLTISEKASKNVPWEYFDGDDIKKIFDALPSKATTPWHLWVAVIGLYTGARISEISALRVENFYRKVGIDAMFLPGTKTDSSPRNVPIHPDLIKAGLLDLVAYRREAGYEMLFDITRSKQNGWGAAPSKWYGPFIRNVAGIKHPKKVFHSFRETVVDHLRQQSASNVEARCEYVGHVPGLGTHFKVYGRRSLGLPVLQTEVVAKIDWQRYCEWSLDLEKIRSTSEALIKDEKLLADKTQP